MKLIFLDRDGVINQYPGDRNYVTSWEEFRFLPNVKKALRELNQDCFKIFIVSNQAGVSKRLYSEQDLNEITQKMLNEIVEAGGRIDSVLYCLHQDQDNCNCRKPKIGLIQKAWADCLNQGLSYKREKDCIFVGDTIRDIKTGKSAGCQTILVFSGKERPQNKDAWEVLPDYTAEDLYSAVQLISKL